MSVPNIFCSDVFVVPTVVRHAFHKSVPERAEHLLLRTFAVASIVKTISQERVRAWQSVPVIFFQGAFVRMTVKPRSVLLFVDGRKSTELGFQWNA